MNKATENKIEELLSAMTLEEKVSMCHAASKFGIAAVERLGIDELIMSDGPHGVRPEVEKHSWTCMNRPEDACTYLPTGTALAATWNPELGRPYGEVLGSEARYRGKDIILGPGVNIIRTPLCGRNFEYMSEDPCLISKMAPDLVKGIQTQDVAACVKHYVLNNQELDRFNVNVEVSDRALYEIYLKGFYSAIIEGEAWSVMGSFSRYQGQFCCHNDFLVNQVLKGDWGFDGVYLTDWGGAHDTEESIHNGLDIEMGTKAPYNEYYLGDAFLERAKESAEVRELLDDKVRRILRLMFRVNKFSPDRKNGEFNTKAHQQVTYDVAAEAMVLLKNEENLLPLDKAKLKKLLVVGPNADEKHAAGGNSSGIMTYYEVTPLQGIRDRLSEVCEIQYESGSVGLSYQPIPVPMLNIIDQVAGCRAYKHVVYTRQADGSVTETVSFLENGDILEGEADAYDIVVSAEIPESGCYSFRFYTNGDAVVKICGEEHVKLQANGREQEITCAFDYEQGDRVDIEIKLSRVKERVNFQFGWITPMDYEKSSSEAELLEKAKAADYVIYCGGLDHSYDTESFDKKSMQLPSEQDVLIPKLLKANPNTVIVLTAGSPVTMPWIDEAKAVVWTWYAGMEAGHVLSDILTGDICPSGKLPFTLPKAYADTPVARYGEYQKTNCRYNEDILVGYRAYDHDQIEPLFPFGHGLSYSRFDYSDLEISRAENESGNDSGDGLTVSFKVTNTGAVTAMETAQVYIGDPVCSVKRPPKELRNFKKVELRPGETAQISLPISALDLSFYDEETKDWKLEPGDFAVYVGSSAGDVRLKGTIVYEIG
ncbi:MAG: glycoside hydrolase family 3 C-terminal domain-containing protein [Lachnospiraceae bacterium]|nr:glycoside hydrolase family 3 C-terminal domain-containing protein [Lachnospiraceae bacterium]